MLHFLSLLLLSGILVGSNSSTDLEMTKIQNHVKVVSALRTVNQTIAFVQTQNNFSEFGRTESTALCFPVGLEAMRILNQLDVEMEYRLATNMTSLNRISDLLNWRCQLASQTELLLQLMTERRQNSAFNDAVHSGMIGEFRRQEDHFFDEIGKKFRTHMFTSVCDFDSRQLIHFLDRLERRSKNLQTLTTMAIGSDRTNTTMGADEWIYLNYNGGYYLNVPEHPVTEGNKYITGDKLILDDIKPTNGGFMFVSMPTHPEIWHLYFRNSEDEVVPLNLGAEMICKRGYDRECSYVMAVSYSPARLKIAFGSGGEAGRLMIMTDKCEILQRSDNVIVAVHEWERVSKIWVSNLYI